MSSPPPASRPDQPDPPPRRTTRWDRLRDRARRAEQVLRDVARETHRFTSADGRPPPEGLTLRLDLRDPADPASDDSPSAEMFDQIAGAVREHAAGLAAFRDGRVYCYWCEGSDCEHAVPPAPESVFAGYSATGQPLWHDLVQTFIDSGDERAGRIYERPFRPIALYQPGRELKRELLHAFGRASKTYDVLAQVVAGYFVPRKGDESGRGPSQQRIAVTFQAVESRDRDGAPRIDVNILCGPGNGADHDLPPDPGLLAARSFARSRFRTLHQALAAADSPGARNKTLGQVPRLLRRTAGLIDRGARRSGRRTRHREERTLSRAQTHKAMDDLAAARDDLVLYDERHQTLIVLGDRHRVHAFAPDGRHVTTFTMQRDAVDRRLRLQRWRPAAPEETRRLRASVRPAAD